MALRNAIHSGPCFAPAQADDHSCVQGFVNMAHFY